MTAPTERDIQIREPQRGDGAGMAAVWRDGASFYRQHFPGDFQVPAEAGLAELFESSLGKPDPPDRRSVVATRGDVIVGMAGGSLEPPYPSSGQQWNPSLGELRLHIDYLVVLSEHWRAGIGQRLVANLESWGREQGATEAFTDTYYASPVSRPFWERRMGYEPRAVILRKRL